MTLRTEIMTTRALRVSVTAQLFKVSIEIPSCWDPFTVKKSAIIGSVSRLLIKRLRSGSSSYLV